MSQNPHQREDRRTFTDLYTRGDYGEKNPNWHVEESPWKAEQIVLMLRKHAITPATICDVGCGAGEVLKQLQDHIGIACDLTGYDISPQAIELAARRANNLLHFKLADIQEEEGTHFDLVLVLDVLEHVEDYFTFLRTIKARSTYSIFHIPLDLSVQTIARPGGLIKVRSAYGHIHYFTAEIALQILRDTGFEVLDYFYTRRAIELPPAELSRKILYMPRKALFALHQNFAARLLGGFSLLVLAQ